MTARRIIFLNLSISLLFAIALLFTDDMAGEQYDPVFIRHMLIAVWFLPFSFLSVLGANNTKK